MEVGDDGRGVRCAVGAGEEAFDRLGVSGGGLGDGRLALRWVAALRSLRPSPLRSTLHAPTLPRLVSPSAPTARLATSPNSRPSPLRSTFTRRPSGGLHSPTAERIRLRRTPTAVAGPRPLAPGP